jgi:hypothetical protein
MRSSWRSRGTRSPRDNLTAGGILLALGLWDLFFVLFRSEDGAFTVSTALLLLVGSLTIWRGVTKLRTQRSRGLTRAREAPEGSRLRSPVVRSSEFVRPACFDLIAHVLGDRDHSAHIPDHEHFRRACPHHAGDGPVPWPRSLPGPWFLGRVLPEAQCQGWPKVISEGNAKRP